MWIDILGYRTLVLFPKFRHPLTCTIGGVSQILTTMLVIPKWQIYKICQKENKLNILVRSIKWQYRTHHYFIHPFLYWMCCFPGAAWFRVIISDNSCVINQIMQHHRCKIFISKRNKKFSLIHIHSALFGVKDTFCIFDWGKISCPSLKL